MVHSFKHHQGRRQDGSTWEQELIQAQGKLGFAPDAAADLGPLRPPDLGKSTSGTPAGIRTADQKKPFQTASETLQLELAGSDDRHRYAVLRGSYG